MIAASSQHSWLTSAFVLVALAIMSFFGLSLIVSGWKSRRTPNGVGWMVLGTVMVAPLVGWLLMFAVLKLVGMTGGVEP